MTRTTHLMKKTSSRLQTMRILWHTILPIMKVRHIMSGHATWPRFHRVVSKTLLKDRNVHGISLCLSLPQTVRTENVIRRVTSLNVQLRNFSLRLPFHWGELLKG